MRVCVNLFLDFVCDMVLININFNMKEMIWPRVLEHHAKDLPKNSQDTINHYYRTGLYSRLFVPAAFGPGTIGGFCPGSNG